MYRSKLATIVGIVATMAGFAAVAGGAQAQISGTIGGDLVEADGNVALQGGPAHHHVTILGVW